MVSVGIPLHDVEEVVGDLQDPPGGVPRMIGVCRQAFDVVYGVRRHRKEGLLKRLGCAGCSRIRNAISDLDIPLDSGDFCPTERQAVDAIRLLEVNGRPTYIVEETRPRIDEGREVPIGPHMARSTRVRKR